MEQDLDAIAPIRAAIDASFLALPPSGIGTYLSALVKYLPLADPGLTVELLSPDWKASPSGNTGRWSQRIRREQWDLLGTERGARQLGVDLLHVPHFAAPLRPSTPLVVTIHDLIPFEHPVYRASRPMQMNLAAMRRTVLAATLILVPSNYTATKVNQHLDIPLERIRVTPLAVDLESNFQPTTAEIGAVLQKYAIRKPYIFNIGGFDVRKNLMVLVSAYARLRTVPGMESLQLVIAGEPTTDNTDVFPPLAPVIEKAGLKNQVRLPGRVSDHDRQILYRSASLYITPSLDEGFGLTALEAMASGIPVIVSNRGALPEVVGDAAIVVDPEAEAIAAAAHQVLSDNDLAKHLRQSGIARAAAFSWLETSRLTAQAYRQALTIRKAG